MYAIIKTGGKQYKVAVGDVIYIEKLDLTQGETVTFSEVLATGKGKTFKLGTPLVKDATVTAEVVKTGKAKKLTVFTYKRRKNYKRKLGHRQPYTKVEIKSID